MSSSGPTRTQRDLADVVETLLDKGVVINADIAVSIGDTELLGIRLRAALASFETAAEYGLEFPEGTDMQRVAEASGREPLDESEREYKDVMALHDPPLTERTRSSQNAPETADSETDSDADTTGDANNREEDTANVND